MVRQGQILLLDKVFFLQNNTKRRDKERRKNNLPFYGGLLPSYCPFFSLNNPLFASKNGQSETKIPALKLVTYFFAVPKGHEKNKAAIIGGK